jgi:hypothetical protein
VDADPGAVPPVIEVPPGCPVNDPAEVTFVGTLIDKDYRTGRFEIDQVRAGSASPWSVEGRIDVRYDDDSKFLTVGDQYLVGAAVDPLIGQLASTVRPPAPLFGGNDVIGVDDTDIDCPTIDDPIRTLNVDGTSVDSGVFSPLFDERRTLLATLAVPTAIAFAVLIGLVVLRRLFGWSIAGIFALGRRAVTPAPDHRAVRIRAHGSGDPPADSLLDASLDEAADLVDSARPVD